MKIDFGSCITYLAASVDRTLILLLSIGRPGISNHLQNRVLLESVGAFRACVRLLELLKGNRTFRADSLSVHHDIVIVEAATL